MNHTFCEYHPIVNLMFFVAVIGMNVFFLHPVTQVLSLAAAICYGSVWIGGKRVLKEQVLPGSFLLFFAALINPLFNHYGVTILGYYPSGNPITLESIVYGLVMGMMLLGMVCWFFLFTKVMTSEKLLYLLSRVTPSLSLLFSMCLRFVPMYRNQLKKITRGQEGIGKSGEGEHLFRRIFLGIQVISILVTYALEQAIETADSMRSRGFGQAKRTFFSMYHMKKKDWICMCVMAVCVVVCLVEIYTQKYVAKFNPRIVVVTGEHPLDRILFFSSYCLLCFMPVLVEWERRWKERNRKIAKKQNVGEYRLWEIS